MHGIGHYFQSQSGRVLYGGTAYSTQLTGVCVIDRDILSGSRTARFNRTLLQEGRAFGANMVPAYPGDKHACMSLIYALPAMGVSLPQMEGLVRQQLDSLADSGPTAAELERIKKVRPTASESQN